MQSGAEKQQDLQRKMVLHGCFEQQQKSRVVNLFTSDVLALCYQQTNFASDNGAALSLNQISTQLAGTPYGAFADWLTAEKSDGTGERASGLMFCRFSTHGAMSTAGLGAAVKQYLAECNAAVLHFLERREREIVTGRAKKTVFRN